VAQERGMAQERGTAQERGALAPRWYYLTAFLFWLASIWWVACPCPPYTALGLLALSAYLSLYWLLFFVSARTAVQRFRVPLLVAMPICWIGTEYLRCHVLGGFSFCALEHAFYQDPMLIQLAGIGGSLLVGGVIMFFGAAMITSFTVRPRITRGPIHLFLYRCATCTVSLGFLQTGVILASLWSLKTIMSDLQNADCCHIVALQGNRQIYIDSDIDYAIETTQQFVDLTYQTIDDWKQNHALPHLIVFPETVCHVPVVQFEGTIRPADLGWSDEEAQGREEWFYEFAQRIKTPVLIGLSTFIFKDDPDNPMRLNSALFVQPDSSTLRYDKMHLVMFGEYIPFAEYLPDNFFLKTLCPEAQRGNKLVAVPIGKGRGKTADGRRQTAENIVEASINICFESSVAHLIRHQILTLRQEGHDPRVLINLSNDGWFRFSHEMEQHLATHVFRAVENRMYYVAAANGGFSAIIEPYGWITRIGKRGTTEAVVSSIYLNLDDAHSLTIYQKYGDGYALICALVALGLAAFNINSAIIRLRKNSSPPR
jgi:apolipoprotein N-acyltransferase